MLETGFLLALVAAISAGYGWYDTWREKRDVEKWLRDELAAHEKTRQTLRDAAARMRRENRERLLGLIEEQRSV